MRLFISIALPDEVIEYIQKLQHYYKEHLFFDGSFPAREHLHATLLFVGEGSESKLHECITALQGITRAPFKVSVVGLNVDRLHHPRTLWLTLASPELTELHTQLRMLSRDVQERTFIPHVTVARIRTVHRRRAFIESVAQHTVPPFVFTVDSIELMHSYIENEMRYHECVYKHVLSSS